LNALTAFKNSENISKSLAMETMLYASAQHQIRKATELVGIKHNSSEIAVLVIGETPETVESTLSMISRHVKAKRENAVLELSRAKASIIQKAFGISNIEIKAIIKKDFLQKALTDLVLERMALLSTKI
jgi:tRNA threonylcarbamoyladenosine modification (KEOPS) complex Cgi121 subunit